jgi:hypothetical protein
MFGTAAIERMANDDGLLFKFDGVKINKDGNKVPEITYVEYLTDGTIQNDKVKSGNWHIKNDQLVLLTGNAYHPSCKHIIERVGNVITNVSVSRNSDSYTSTEVFISTDSNEGVNISSIQTISFVVIVGLLFILYNKKK